MPKFLFQNKTYNFLNYFTVQTADSVSVVFESVADIANKESQFKAEKILYALRALFWFLLNLIEFLKSLTLLLNIDRLVLNQFLRRILKFALQLLVLMGNLLLASRLTGTIFLMFWVYFINQFILLILSSPQVLRFDRTADGLLIATEAYQLPPRTQYIEFSPLSRVIAFWESIASPDQQVQNLTFADLSTGSLGFYNPKLNSHGNFSDIWFLVYIIYLKFCSQLLHWFNLFYFQRC